MTHRTNRQLMAPPNETPLENMTIRQQGGHIDHYNGDWIANPWDGPAIITPTMAIAANHLKDCYRRQVANGNGNGYKP